MIQAGDAIELGSQDSAVRHCFLVISDPAQDPQDMVLVSVSSYEEWKEATCIIEPSEPDNCPFIKHTSIVDFAAARMLGDGVLTKMVANGDARPLGHIGEDLLNRVRQAADESPNLAGRFWNKLYEQGLVTG